MLVSLGGALLTASLLGWTLAGILACVEGPLGTRRAALSGPGAPRAYNPTLPSTEPLGEDHVEAPRAPPGLLLPWQTRPPAPPLAREDGLCL